MLLVFCATLTSLSIFAAGDRELARSIDAGAASSQLIVLSPSILTSVVGQPAAPSLNLLDGNWYYEYQLSEDQLVTLAIDQTKH